MTIEYKPADPRPAVREAVIVNGRPIGEIWEMEHGVQCSLKTMSGAWFGGIAKTKEEALGVAINRARKEATDLLNAANELEAELAKGVAK